MHLPIAIRAKRVSSRTVDGLSRLGDQFTFHAIDDLVVKIVFIRAGFCQSLLDDLKDQRLGVGAS